MAEEAKEQASPPAVAVVLSSLSVTELKELLGKRGIDYGSCVEKSDLIALAETHNVRE